MKLMKTTNTEKTFEMTYGPTVTVYTDPNPNMPADIAKNRMDRAFALVCPRVWGRADWKEQVHAVISGADLVAAGVVLPDVVLAVEFFTATKAQVIKTKDAVTGARCFIVKADGYRRGPAH